MKIKCLWFVGSVNEMQMIIWIKRLLNVMIVEWDIKSTGCWQMRENLFQFCYHSYRNYSFRSKHITPMFARAVIKCQESFESVHLNHRHLSLNLIQSLTPLALVFRVKPLSWVLTIAQRQRLHVCHVICHKDKAFSQPDRRLPFRSHWWCCNLKLYGFGPSKGVNIQSRVKANLWFLFVKAFIVMATMNSSLFSRQTFRRWLIAGNWVRKPIMKSTNEIGFDMFFFSFLLRFSDTIST